MPDDSYKEIRERVERLYNARKEILIHTVVFVIINLLMWFGWRFSGLYNYVSMIWLLLISGGWGVGYLAHLIDYLMKEATERAVQQAVDRERAWQSGTLDEKPKRDQHARLSADGELELIRFDNDDDEDTDRGKAYRQRRS